MSDRIDMSETNGEQNCLTEISEMLAEQNWRYLNFSNRLHVAGIRVQQIGSEANLIDSEIKSVRLSLEHLIDSMVEGRDVRGKLGEIDTNVQRIEMQLTT